MAEEVEKGWRDRHLFDEFRQMVDGKVRDELPITPARNLAEG